MNDQKFEYENFENLNLESLNVSERNLNKGILSMNGGKENSTEWILSGT